MSNCLHFNNGRYWLSSEDLQPWRRLSVTHEMGGFSAPTLQKIFSSSFCSVHFAVNCSVQFISCEGYYTWWVKDAAVCFDSFAIITISIFWFHTSWYFLLRRPLFTAFSSSPSVQTEGAGPLVGGSITRLAGDAVAHSGLDEPPNLSD